MSDKRDICDGDDLTIAYMAGFHSRDEDFRTLRAVNADLEAQRTVAGLSGNGKEG